MIPEIYGTGGDCPETRDAKQRADQKLAELAKQFPEMSLLVRPGQPIGDEGIATLDRLMRNK